MNRTFSSLRGDVFGGVVAAFVTLPLALSLGALSGMGPAAGITGAVVAGAVAAAFGSTRGMITGPNCSLAMAMSIVVVSHDDPVVAASVVAVLAGIVQITLGSLKLGRLLSYLPYSVISGIGSGVGLVIFFSQTLPLIGSPVELGGLFEAVRSWPDAISDFSPGALAIGALSFAVAALWPAKLRRYFPSSAAALILGTLFGVLWFKNEPVVGRVTIGLPDFSWSEMFGIGLVELVPAAVAIGILGSVDSLICAQLADSLTHSSHRPNQEVVAQGLANASAGFVGGMPCAGTAGMFVNIETGGRSPLAGVLCAMTLLALATGLADLVELIPEAVLAGILCKIGLDLVDWRIVLRLLDGQREHSFVLVATVGLTVFSDLITALVVGLLGSALVNARQFERLELDSVLSVPLLDRRFLGEHPSQGDIDDFAARVGLLAFRGSFTVASAREMFQKVSLDIEEHDVVIMDMSRTVYFDDSAAIVIERLIKVAGLQGTHCIVVGLNGQPDICLRALRILRLIPHDSVVNTMDEAREAALRYL